MYEAALKQLSAELQQAAAVAAAAATATKKNVDCCPIALSQVNYYYLLFQLPLVYSRFLAIFFLGKAFRKTTQLNTKRQKHEIKTTKTALNLTGFCQRSMPARK